jgi:DNA-nicking Smr family endonuclease
MPTPAKKSINKPARKSASKPAIKDLRGLKALKQDIQAQAELAAKQEAERLAAARQRQAEKELFKRAIGPVKALPARHAPGQRAGLRPEPPAPVPVQHQLDEMAVMREAISDEFDVSTLLDTDDALSFRRPGMGPDVLRKLRRGGWSVQGQIDLHGLRREEARESLSQFIRDAHKTGWRCVRVVHGKGLGSPGKAPVLKGRVHSWLTQKKEVLAFAQARPADGGAGALMVLLAQS